MPIILKVFGITNNKEINVRNEIGSETESCSEDESDNYMDESTWNDDESVIEEYYKLTKKRSRTNPFPSFFENKKKKRKKGK